MFKQHVIATAGVILLVTALTLIPQGASSSSEEGQVLALETAWNHAIEVKDTKALDMLLADTMVALDSDGTFSNKSQYLAGIKAPDFQPSQTVNETNHVQLYGDSAVAVGIFRIKAVEKGKPYVHRERTIDTWVKMNGTWKCVVAIASLMPNRPE